MRTIIILDPSSFLFYYYKYMHVANSSFFLVLILDIVIAHVVLITIVIVSRNGILFLLHDVEFCYLLFGYLHAI